MNEDREVKGIQTENKVVQLFLFISQDSVSQSYSLWPHGLQHTRPPCPSSTPRATQTHVHHISDAIQPSHPLLSPSAPTFSLPSINSLVLSFLYSPTLTSIHDYWKTIALTRQSLAGKVMSLLFNKLSRLIIPRSKHLSISWLQSPSVVILETQKVSHCFHCFSTVGKNPLEEME